VYKLCFRSKTACSIQIGLIDFNTKKTNSAFNGFDLIKFNKELIIGMIWERFDASRVFFLPAISMTFVENLLPKQEQHPKS